MHTAQLTEENMEKQWFAIHTYSGFENKVRQQLEERVVLLKEFENKVTRVLVPAENIIEIKGGKKKTAQRNLMPGYVLIEMEPDEDLFNTIRQMSGVSGFVGAGLKPTPLTQHEMETVLDLIADKKSKPKPEVRYRQGEQVKVIEGPFANFIGVVDEIDEEKSRLKVMVSIFGRPTSVELDLLQVEAI
jgi:transcriptional antiterminator NusG